MLKKVTQYVGWNLRMPWWLFWSILLSLTWYYLARRVISWDLWWHMAAGRYLVENGVWGYFLHPLTWIEGGPFLLEKGIYPPDDFFTFSETKGSTFISKTWFGDVVFHYAYEFWGFYGLQLLRASFIITPVFLMLNLTRWKHNIWTLLASFVMIIGTMQKHLIKNAIIILPFIGFMFWSWVQIRYHKRYFLLWLYPPMFILWNNFHGSAMVGICIFFVMVIGELLDSWVIPNLRHISMKNMSLAFKDTRLIITISILTILVYFQPLLALSLALLTVILALFRDQLLPIYINFDGRKSSNKGLLFILITFAASSLIVNHVWRLPVSMIGQIASKYLPISSEASPKSKASSATAKTKKKEKPKTVKERLKKVFRIIFKGTDADLVAEYQWPFEILYVLSVKALFLLSLFYIAYLLIRISLGWQGFSFALEFPSFVSILFLGMGYLRTVSYPFVIALPFMVYGLSICMGDVKRKQPPFRVYLLLGLLALMALLSLTPIVSEFYRLFYNALGFAKYLAIPFMAIPLLIGLYHFFISKEIIPKSISKWIIPTASLTLGFYTLGCLFYFSNYQYSKYKEGNFHNVSGFLDTEPGLGKSVKFFDGMAEYVTENLPPKNIYNTYNMGGYLQWKWYEAERKVFIDGRSIIYNLDFYKAYTQNNAQTYIQKHELEHAIINMLVDKDRLQLFLKQGWTPIAYDPGMTVLRAPKGRNIRSVYGILPTYQEGERSIAEMSNLDHQAFAGFIDVTVQNMMLLGRLKDAESFLKGAMPQIEQFHEKKIQSQLNARLNHLKQINGIFGTQNHPALAKLSKKLFDRIQGYPYHMIMGETHLALQQLTKAEVEFSRAYKLKPKEPDVLLKLGSVLVNSKKYDRALMAFQEGIKINQKDVRFHLAAVQPLLELKNEAKALQAALNATKLSPGAGEAHFYHGMVLHRMKKWPEAKKSLELAIKLKPGLKEAQQLINTIPKP